MVTLDSIAMVVQAGLAVPRRSPAPRRSSSSCWRRSPRSPLPRTTRPPAQPSPTSSVRSTSPQPTASRRRSRTSPSSSVPRSAPACCCSAPRRSSSPSTPPPSVSRRWWSAASEPAAGPGDATEGGTLGPLQQMGVGIRAFLSSSTVVVLAGFSIVASFLYGTDTVLFVVLSKQQLGTGSAGYGYLLAALGVGGLVRGAVHEPHRGDAPAGHDHRRRHVRVRAADRAARGGPLTGHRVRHRGGARRWHPRRRRARHHRAAAHCQRRRRRTRLRRVLRARARRRSRSARCSCPSCSRRSG